MCEVCGCDDEANVTATNLRTGTTAVWRSGRLEAHEHVHADGTRHSHAHGHHHHVHAPEGTHSGLLATAAPRAPTVLELEARVLDKNDALAERNRAWLADHRIVALNLMGAPGAGKTSLLERTIRELGESMPLFVIEGDQATAHDAERIRAAGAAALQVNTGTGCHLDADMVARGLAELDVGAGSMVFVENVGNLVCPALFDLGEHRRIVVLSVTEGDDKPLKYPHMFRAADLVLLNKTDLLPYVDFDVERATALVREINPEAAVLRVSARSGEGLGAWYAWLRNQKDVAREQRHASSAAANE